VSDAPLSTPGVVTAPTAGLQHIFYPYAGAQQYLSGVVAYIEQARADGATVVVAMPEDRRHLLREALSASESDLDPNPAPDGASHHANGRDDNHKNGDQSSDQAAHQDAALPAAQPAAQNGTVTFMDTAALGGNPGRLIPAWQDWINRNGRSGEVRGISESPWSGRSAAQLSELRYHEWLLNIAFAGTAAWSLLCPYDTDGQSPEFGRSLASYHPLIWNGAAGVAAVPYTALPYAFEPFDQPPDSYDGDELAYGFENLPEVREHVSRRAAVRGLSLERTRDLMLAASEIASNSIRHAGGRGTLRTWFHDGSLTCEFRDAGVITDPMAGRMRPTASASGGCGLWFVHQLCDLVEIRSDARDGTRVRLHVDLRPESAPLG
jgi:anti-sigma regulatory factor (Ser/Thr protein kinase)